MSNLLDPGNNEIWLSSFLRFQAVDEIDSLGIELSAIKLDLAPGGVESLLRKQTWDLITAYRVCSILELDVIGKINSLVRVDFGVKE